MNTSPGKREADDPEEPIHNCLGIPDAIKGIQPDLTDIPFTARDADLYLDGSSFIQEGTRYVCVVVGALQARRRSYGHKPAQRAEIIALTQALKME